MNSRGAFWGRERQTSIKSQGSVKCSYSLWHVKMDRHLVFLLNHKWFLCSEQHFCCYRFTYFNTDIFLRTGKSRGSSTMIMIFQVLYIRSSTVLNNVFFLFCLSLLFQHFPTPFPFPFLSPAYLALEPNSYSQTGSHGLSKGIPSSPLLFSPPPSPKFCLLHPIYVSRSSFVKIVFYLDF